MLRFLYATTEYFHSVILIFLHFPFFFILSNLLIFSYHLHNFILTALLERRSETYFRSLVVEIQ